MQFQGSEASNSDWAERNEIWLKEAARRQPKRRKRERNSSSLILCGHGVSLRVEQGTLVIRDGFTHYPQERESYRFFPGDLALPTRILLLDGSGTISFDVLSWLSEQRVSLIRMRWTGEAAAVLSGSGYSADRNKVRWQVETASDERKRLAYAAELIRRKLARSIVTLESCFEPSPLVERAVERAKLGMDRLLTVSGDMNSVRAIEGECAALYFGAWKTVGLRWKGTERRPIPDHWRSYGSRTTVGAGVRVRNRHATHPVNALLNYAYAVKLAHVQVETVSEGYDPMIGIMHEARGDRPAFALDLIEPERPQVDAAILELIRTRPFAAVDFVIRSDGLCRLAPQLARTIATLAARSSRP